MDELEAVPAGEWGDGPRTWRDELDEGDRVLWLDGGVTSGATVIEWVRVDVTGMPWALRARLDHGKTVLTYRPAAVLGLLSKAEPTGAGSMADSSWILDLAYGDRISVVFPGAIEAVACRCLHSWGSDADMTGGAWVLPVERLDSGARRFVEYKDVHALISKAPTDLDPDEFLPSKDKPVWAWDDELREYRQYVVIDRANDLRVWSAEWLILLRKPKGDFWVPLDQTHRERPADREDPADA